MIRDQVTTFLTNWLITQCGGEGVVCFLKGVVGLLIPWRGLFKVPGGVPKHVGDETDTVEEEITPRINIWMEIFTIVYLRALYYKQRVRLLSCPRQ